jgi:hypothetical protein
VLTYDQIDKIVAAVLTSNTQPLRPEDLAPADRERLAVTASHDGVSPQEALACGRRRLLSELAARQDARRTALIARKGGTTSLVERRLQN